MARLFAQIDTPHRQVYRDMTWRELFLYGEAGATPAGFAADLIKHGKGKGDRRRVCGASGPAAW
jgi:hypothetical protein